MAAHMQLTLRGAVEGAVTFVLNTTACPTAVENFRRLCLPNDSAGRKAVQEQAAPGVKLPASLIDSLITRVVKGSVVEFGTSGTGSLVAVDADNKLTGATFKDEFPSASWSHDQAGMLCMSNFGANANASKFYLTLAPVKELDGKHVVFGRVVAGLDVLERLGATKVNVRRGDAPLVKIAIAACAAVEFDGRFAESQRLRDRGGKERRTRGTLRGRDDDDDEDADAEASAGAAGAPGFFSSATPEASAATTAMKRRRGEQEQTVTGADGVKTTELGSVSITTKLGGVERLRFDKQQAMADHQDVISSNIKTIADAQKIKMKRKDAKKFKNTGVKASSAAKTMKRKTKSLAGRY
jgi:cyclophilin family peptidyl-prolyl cis-trans isomerase